MITLAMLPASTSHRTRLDQDLTLALDALDQQALRRRLPAPTLGAPAASVIRGSTPCICLDSNNYLGLAAHPALAEGGMAAIREAGCSATGSRLLSGNLALHERLEQRLAAFKGSEAALLFNSGYTANLGTLTALAGKGDLIVSDRLNHASLIDGCRASGAEVAIAPHRDVEAVVRLLDRQGFRRRFLVTDGVFSMDGAIAPLPELMPLCLRFEATLVLDEAHATGVMGRTGRGTLEHFGLVEEAVQGEANRPSAQLPGIIQIGTLGKALGGFGAFVAASRPVCDWLLNRARPFVFSTALPPAVLGAALAALDVLDAEPERRERLHSNAQRLRSGLRDLGYRVPEGETPIVPVLVGEPDAALALAQALREEGVLAMAVRPPSVPEGTSRLRVTAMATHTAADLEAALSAFASAARRLGILA